MEDVGRVTRSLRRRLNSVDTDSVGRTTPVPELNILKEETPLTPRRGKKVLTTNEDISTPERSNKGRLTRRRSTTETIFSPAITTTPLKKTRRNSVCEIDSKNEKLSIKKNISPDVLIEENEKIEESDEDIMSSSSKKQIKNSIVRIAKLNNKIGNNLRNVKKNLGNYQNLTENKTETNDKSNFEKNIIDIKDSSKLNITSLGEMNCTVEISDSPEGEMNCTVEISDSPKITQNIQMDAEKYNFKSCKSPKTYPFGQSFEGNDHNNSINIKTRSQLESSIEHLEYSATTPCKNESPKEEQKVNSSSSKSNSKSCKSPKNDPSGQSFEVNRLNNSKNMNKRRSQLESSIEHLEYSATTPCKNESQKEEQKVNSSSSKSNSKSCKSPKNDPSGQSFEVGRLNNSKNMNKRRSQLESSIEHLEYTATTPCKNESQIEEQKINSSSSKSNSKSCKSPKNDPSVQSFEVNRLNNSKNMNKRRSQLESSIEQLEYSATTPCKNESQIEEQKVNSSSSKSNSKSCKSPKNDPSGQSFEVSRLNNSKNMNKRRSQLESSIEQLEYSATTPCKNESQKEEQKVNSSSSKSNSKSCKSPKNDPSGQSFEVSRLNNSKNMNKRRSQLESSIEHLEYSEKTPCKTESQKEEQKINSSSSKSNSEIQDTATTETDENEEIAVHKSSQKSSSKSCKFPKENKNLEKIKKCDISLEGTDNDSVTMSYNIEYISDNEEKNISKANLSHKNKSNSSNIKNKSFSINSQQAEIIGTHESEDINNLENPLNIEENEVECEDINNLEKSLNIEENEVEFEDIKNLEKSLNIEENEVAFFNETENKIKSVTFNESCSISDREPSKFPKTPVTSKGKNPNASVDLIIDENDVYDSPTKLNRYKNGKKDELSSTLFERINRGDNINSYTPNKIVQENALKSSTPLNQYVDQNNLEKKENKLIKKNCTDKNDTNEKFSRSWNQSIRRSKGEVIDELIPKQEQSKSADISLQINNSLKDRLRSNNWELREQEKEELTDEIECENEFIDDQAQEIENDDESMDEEERQYLEENEIIEKGFSLGSEDTEDLEENTSENDSFIVSDDEAEVQFSSGSTDDSTDNSRDISKRKIKTTKKFRRLKSIESDIDDNQHTEENASSANPEKGSPIKDNISINDDGSDSEDSFKIYNKNSSKKSISNGLSNKSNSSNVKEQSVVMRCNEEFLIESKNKSMEIEDLIKDKCDAYDCKSNRSLLIEEAKKYSESDNHKALNFDISKFIDETLIDEKTNISINSSKSKNSKKDVNSFTEKKSVKMDYEDSVKVSDNEKMQIKNKFITSPSTFFVSESYKEEEDEDFVLQEENEKEGDDSTNLDSDLSQEIFPTSLSITSKADFIPNIQNKDLKKVEIQENDGINNEICTKVNSDQIDNIKKNKPEITNSGNVSYILNRCNEILNAANEAKMKQKIKKNETLRNKKNVHSSDVQKQKNVEAERKQKNIKNKLAISKAIKHAEEILTKKIKVTESTVETKSKSKLLSADIIEALSVKSEKLEKNPENMKNNLSELPMKAQMLPNKRENVFDEQKNSTNILKRKSNFVSTSSGLFIEEPVNIIQKKISKIKLPTGTVYEEPITPIAKRNINRFIESPVTPIGFKVRSILSAGQKDIPEFKLKKRVKRKIIEDPINVLPKTIWTSSGEFVEEIYKSVNKNSENISTDFFAIPLKTKRQKAQLFGVGVTNEKAIEFKRRAFSYIDNCRESSKQLLQRKERQKF